MKKRRSLMESALTIKGIVVFVLFVLVACLTFAVLINPRFSLFTAREIFPGYVMRTYDSTPLRELDVPDIAPYIDDRQRQTAPPEDEGIIITYKNIFSFKSFDIVRENLYNIDRTAYVSDDVLDFEKLVFYESEIDLYGEKPKILIFHTHGSEAFADSREGVQGDTIIGVGEELARILSDKYGLSVMHHKGVYDMENGEIVRGNSYEKMEPEILEILARNPSIEVLIDLHRDSLPEGRKLIADIDGKPTAQIMYFNGVCMLNDKGAPKPTEGLENEYIMDNLGLSLRMKLLTNELFPDLARKNYIKPYRYSLHMKPNSLLIECGSDANTVLEVKNAMAPLADVLVKAFS